MSSAKNQSTLDAIVALAEEIARAAPDCAGQALQIVDLVRGLESEPDQDTIRDALDGQMGEGDLSDVSTQRVASEVLKAVT
jgi:hypothetical protein